MNVGGIFSAEIMNEERVLGALARLTQDGNQLNIIISVFVEEFRNPVHVLFPLLKSLLLEEGRGKESRVFGEFEFPSAATKVSHQTKTT